jgi:hypothetical protein
LGTPYIRSTVEAAGRFIGAGSDTTGRVLDGNDGNDGNGVLGW